jgi:hypothetical protein
VQHAAEVGGRKGHHLHPVNDLQRAQAFEVR